MAGIHRRRIEFPAMSSAPSPAETAPAPASERAAYSNWHRWFYAILVMSAVLFFARLGARALWSSEFRWAEIAREMLTTRNYFWPTINGHRLLRQTARLLLAGHLVHLPDHRRRMNECGVAHTMRARRRARGGVPADPARATAVRLRTGDRRRRLILATSFSFVFFSRHASADVETLTGELAALLLFLKYEKRPDGWWVVWLWIVMAVTSLTKGLLGFVLPIMVIGLYARWPMDGAVGEKILHGAIGARLRWILGRNRWLFNWRSIPRSDRNRNLFVAASGFRKKSRARTRVSRWSSAKMWCAFFQPFDHRGPDSIFMSM